MGIVWIIICDESYHRRCDKRIGDVLIFIDKRVKMSAKTELSVVSNLDKRREKL